jgi:predicted dehydrogenase
MINIALVGLGYWGPNLARNIATLAEGRLHTLCDVRSDRLRDLAKQYPASSLQGDYRAVLEDREVQAVVIAAPVAVHFEMAAAALRAGKHVLVEKPLAQTAEQCRKLIALAEAQSRVLMVGHVFLYNAAVRKVKEYIQSGELGEIYYVYSQRLNLGIVRRDVNALWNFGPHDLSILCYWLDGSPQRVVARGFSYIQPNIEDVVFVSMEFPGGIGASVHISWLDPHKIRRMTVVGSRKMVVYDDVSTDAKIMLFDKGITKKPTASLGDGAASDRSLGGFDSFGEFQLLHRAGDVLIPKLGFTEPLKEECQHFVDCIRLGRQPLTDGYEGLRVVEALEAAQRSLVEQAVTSERST